MVDVSGLICPSDAMKMLMQSALALVISLSFLACQTTSQECPKSKKCPMSKKENCGEKCCRK